jgi:hypothetical protein
MAAAQTQPSGEEIVAKVLESDPWGLSGSEITARVSLIDKAGAKSELAFTARSLRHDPPLSKSLVRFTAPPELADAGYLQVQKRDGEDERYLYLPELKRSRRISGSLRSNAFMGTDFSFADLDRRDMRDAAVVVKGEENVGRFPCWRIELTPKRADSQYGRLVMWVRKDIFLALKTECYDKATVLVKTLTVEEVKRIAGRWFISRAKMVNHRDSHSTVLSLEKIVPRTDIPDDEFTVRNLEKG